MGNSDDVRGGVLLRRGLAYSGEHVVRLVVGLLVGVLVARHLGPDELGLLQFGVSLMAMASPLALLGLPSLLARDFPVRADAEELLGAATRLQTAVALGLGASAAVFFASSRDWSSDAVLVGLALAPLPVAGVSQTMRVFLESKGRAAALVKAGTVSVVLASAMRLAGVALGGGAPFFALVGVLEAALLLFLMARFGRVAMQSLWDGGHAHARPELGPLLREALPLLLSGIAVTVYLRIDVVMLASMSGDQPAGIYSVASRLSEVWYFIPGAAIAALRPLLARLHADGRDEEYESVLSRTTAGLMALSYAVVAAGILVSSRVIVFLYGTEFAEAADVLAVHLVSLPFVFLGAFAGPWFVDRGQSRALLLRTLVGAGVNVMANLMLIPSMDGVGAAWATVLSYSVAGFVLNVGPRRTRSLLRVQMRGILLVGLLPAPLRRRRS